MREKYSNNSKKILSPAFLESEKYEYANPRRFFMKRGILADVLDMKMNSKLK